MTAPQTNPGAPPPFQSQQQEWDDFLQKKQYIMDQILGGMTDFQARFGQHPVQPEQTGMVTQPTQSIVPQDPAQAQLQHQDLVSRAQFWKIPNPEQYSSDQLYQILQQHRAGIQQTEPSDYLHRGVDYNLLAATAAGGAMTKMFGNVIGNLESLPFGGLVLGKILGGEVAKTWLMHTASQADEANKYLAASMAPSTRMAGQFISGAGQMVGMILPAMAAWEGLGVVGAGAATTRLPWLARAGTAMARASVRGGVAGYLMGDPNAGFVDKAFNVGLGGVMGWASQYNKPLMIAAGGTSGAMLGAQAGGMIGLTPEEQHANAIRGGVAGFALGALAPMLSKAQQKVQSDFKSPLDDLGPPSDPGDAPPQSSANPPKNIVPTGGGAGADTPFETGKGPTINATYAGQPLYTNTPDYEVSPLAPERLPFEQPQALGAPQVKGLLPYRRFSGNVTNGPSQLLGSVVADINGNPLQVYHGTGAAFDQFNPSLLDSEALYGPGIYHTESPEIANGYAGKRGDIQWIPGGKQLALTRVNASIQQHGGLSAFNGYLPAVPPTPDTVVDWANDLGIDLGDLSYDTDIVRPAYLSIKNPFDVDAQYDQHQVADIFNKLKVVQPNYAWDSMHSLIKMQSDLPTVQGLAIGGDELYTSLSAVAQTPTHPDFYNQKMGGSGYFNGHAVIGKAALNQALQQIGYDGITHIGGAITGSPPHRVWIAFQPEQVHQPWTAKLLQQHEAVAAAQSMTKQASVLESQYLPQALGKAQLTDSDVIQAQKITNPGGNSVVKNVGAPIQVTKDHPDVTFLRNMDGGLDALVGEFSPRQILQYKSFGLWEGQRVVAPSGGDATIVSIDRDGTAVLDVAGHRQTTQANRILPSRWGTDQMKQVGNESMWTQYKADLLSYMNYNAEQAHQVPVESIWDPRVSAEMQHHLDAFLDRAGIADMGQRHLADEFFNQRWTEEAQALDPEMQDVIRNAGKAAADAASEREASAEPIPQPTEELAQKRGFIWIRQPGTDGGVLRDNLNPESAFEVPLQTDAAARDFLHNVDRSMPDLAPVAEVPAEVAETGVSADSAPLEAHLGHEEEADLLANHINEAAGTGGGYGGNQALPIGTGGAGGDKPPGGGAAGPADSLDPPEGESLGDQFAKLRRDDFRKLMEGTRLFTKNNMRYTRYLMAKAETWLYKAGIDRGRMWSQYEALDVARLQSDQASNPWIERYASIMRKFAGPLMRHGDVTRIHGIEDPAARNAAWDSLVGKQYNFLGMRYTKAHVDGFKAADAELSSFNQDYFTWLGNLHDDSFARPLGNSVGESSERGLYRYMVNTAAKQAVGSVNAAQDIYVDDQNHLTPELKFFEDWARQRNLQFRVVDPRTLGNYLIRAGHFDKYQQAAYKDIVDTWSDPRIPEEFRRLMLSHAQAMKYGYDASGDLAISGLQGAMQRLGIPITQREAATLLQLPVTGMYRSMLGGRTSIFFRDSLQPLLSLAKTDLAHLGSVYGDVLSGNRAKFQELWQRGVDGGWIRPEQPQMEGASLFETGPELQPFESLTLNPAEAARREALAQIGDLGAAIPEGIKRLDKATNTLELYGRLQQLNRLIAGEGAWRQATAGLKEFRASQAENAIRGTPEQAMTYEQLADRTRFSSFEQPIQRKLNELVEAGDDEGAANLFAREVTNWSQFKYGRAEQPEIVRGFGGRMLYTFGNFSGQFLEAMNSAVRNGTPAQKARALMVVGTMAYGLHELEQKTGWSFGKMAWSNSLKYAGGPPAQGLATGYEALTGAIAASEGRPLSPVQTSAIQQLTTGHPFLETGASVFPWTGYVRTAGQLGAAAQGDTPGQQMMRYLITGDRGNTAMGFGLTPEEQQRRVQDLINHINQSNHPGAGAIQP